MSVVAAREKLKEKTAKKKTPKSNCGELKAQRDSLDKQIEATEKKNAERRKKAEDKLTARQKKENDAQAARHKKEVEALDVEFGCVPKKKAKRSKKAKPAAGEAPPSSPPGKANNGRAKKPSKKPGKKDTAPSPSPEPQPRPVPPRPRPTPAAAAPTASRPRLTSVEPVLERVPTLPVGALQATASTKGLKEAIAAVKRAHFKNTDSKVWDVVTLWAGDGRLGLRIFSRYGELVVTIPAEVRRPGTVYLDFSSFEALGLEGGERATVLAEAGLTQLHIAGVITDLVASGSAGDDGRVYLPAHDVQRVDPRVARRGIEAVLYAVSTDEARVNLNGLYITQDSGQTLLAATDGHRLVTYTDRAFPIAVKDFIVGRAEIRVVVSLLPQSQGMITAHGYDGSLLFAGASERLRWTFSAYQINVVFPPYQKVIPSNFSHVCDLTAAEFRGLLKPLVVGKQWKFNSGTFTYADGDLQIKRNNPDQPATGRMPIRCKPGEPLIFSANLLYFLQAVSNGPMADSEVSFFYQDPADNIKGRREGKPLEGTLDPIRLVAKGEGWETVAVIMPMRL